MGDNPPITCSSCPHWHALPANPMALGAPRQGECRGAPPVLLPIPQPGGMGAASVYPQTHEHFSACGHHPLVQLRLRHSGKPKLVEA